MKFQFYGILSALLMSSSPGWAISTPLPLHLAVELTEAQLTHPSGAFLPPNLWKVYQIEPFDPAEPLSKFKEGDTAVFMRCFGVLQFKKNEYTIKCDDLPYKLGTDSRSGKTYTAYATYVFKNNVYTIFSKGGY